MKKQLSTLMLVLSVSTSAFAVQLECNSSKDSPTRSQFHLELSSDDIQSLLYQSKEYPRYSDLHSLILTMGGNDMSPGNSGEFTYTIGNIDHGVCKPKFQ